VRPRRLLALVVLIALGPCAQAAELRAWSGVSQSTLSQDRPDWSSAEVAVGLSPGANRWAVLSAAETRRGTEVGRQIGLRLSRPLGPDWSGRVDMALGAGAAFQARTRVGMGVERLPARGRPGLELGLDVLRHPEASALRLVTGAGVGGPTGTLRARLIALQEGGRWMGGVEVTAERQLGAGLRLTGALHHLPEPDGAVQVLTRGVRLGVGCEVGAHWQVGLSALVERRDALTRRELGVTLGRRF